MMEYSIQGLVNGFTLNFQLLTVDGNPMKFSLEGYKQQYSAGIIKLIDTFGGKITEPDAPGVIVLSDGNHSSDILCKRYDIKFLHDSIANQQIQDLENYRIESPVDQEPRGPTNKRRRVTSQDNMKNTPSGNEHNSKNSMDLHDKVSEAAKSDHFPRDPPTNKSRTTSSREASKRSPPYADRASNRPLVKRCRKSLRIREENDHEDVEVIPQEGEESSDETIAIVYASKPAFLRKRDKFKLREPDVIELSDDDSNDSDSSISLLEPGSESRKEQNEGATLRKSASSSGCQRPLDDNRQETRKLPEEILERSSTNEHENITNSTSTVSDVECESRVNGHNVENVQDNVPLSASSEGMEFVEVDLYDPSLEIQQLLELEEFSIPVLDISEPAMLREFLELAPDQRNAVTPNNDDSNTNSEASKNVSSNNEEQSKTESENSGSTSKNSKKKSNSYSEEDERCMFQYIIEKKAIHQGRLPETWNEFLETQVLDKRNPTATGLAKYFCNVLRKKCHQLTDNQDVLREFKRNSPWTEAECKAMIDFLIENDCIKRALSSAVWHECLKATSLLQDCSRTASALYGKFRHDLRYNYFKYINDPRALSQFKELEIKHGSHSHHQKFEK